MNTLNYILWILIHYDWCNMMNSVWWIQCDECNVTKQYDELGQWMQFTEYIEFYMMSTNSLWLMQYD